MDDLDALLADLQNTVASENSAPSNNVTPGYGSLNGVRSYTTTAVPYDTQDSPLASQTTIYQNCEIIEESEKARNCLYDQSGTGERMPSLNNNLSELDTLLHDLSNARYNMHVVNRERYISEENSGPVMRCTSSMSTSRPTVDSLLEELSTAVPNGDMSEERVKVTVQETTTEVQPIESYSTTHHFYDFDKRNYMGNGHTASNATKELDDLMASLSEFKLLPIHGWPHYRNSNRSG